VIGSLACQLIVSGDNGNYDAVARFYLFDVTTLLIPRHGFRIVFIPRRQHDDRKILVDQSIGRASFRRPDSPPRGCRKFPSASERLRVRSENESLVRDTGNWCAGRTAGERFVDPRLIALQNRLHFVREAHELQQEMFRAVFAERAAYLAQIHGHEH